MKFPKTGAPREALLNPSDPSWEAAEAQSVTLAPTPLAMQPSQWIQGAFKSAQYGQLASAELRGLHTGELVAVRVDWAVGRQAIETYGPDQFTDACAVMLPFVKNAPFITMGQTDQWVNMWLWRADGFGPFAVTAAGLGTTQRLDDGVLATQHLWRDGRWRVVFVRALDPGKPKHHVPLEVGTPWQINLALWSGADQERGGLKSYGQKWIELDLAS